MAAIILGGGAGAHLFPLKSNTFTPDIENEYGPTEYELGDPARAYSKWAGNMVVGLKMGVPWIMCKQDDALDPTINTCNGFYCDYFTPNKYFKPKMWTEAWSGWFTEFGGTVPYRPTEDLAFSVDKFIQTGGSFINYYMIRNLSTGYFGEQVHMIKRLRIPFIKSVEV